MFQDKYIIVSGAASGIGRATAAALMAHGAHIAFWDIDPQVGQIAGESDYAIVDVSEPDSIQKALTDFLARVGRLDGVVHCAGIARVGRFADLDVAQYRTLTLVNLFGSMALAHAVLPHLTQTRGSLVLVSSVSAFYGPPDFVAYGATKAGVLNLAQGLRVEYEGTGVHIGVVCPHFVNTPMYQQESRKSAFAASQSLFVELRGADVVAEAILDGMRQRRFMIWTGWRPRLIFWVTRLAFFLAHGIMARTWRNSRPSDDKATIGRL